MTPFAVEACGRFPGRKKGDTGEDAIIRRILQREVLLMRFQVLIAVILVFLLFLPTMVLAEDPPDPQFGRRRGEGPPPPEINDKEHAKARNQERQRALKADTEKLLELATELKQYVDKTNESVLSLDVIKKCEEIEKLAKSVREKMRGQ